MEVSTGRVVLDTDVLIDFLRGLKGCINFVRGLKDGGMELATTSINIFELAWGAYKIDRAKVGEISNLSRVLRVLSLSEREALRAGEEIGYLESIGMPIDLRDILIGVIARENGASIATGNVKHFKRIRGLTVIEYKRGL
jgi:tRNA(fMet)-specific endonuclease VapC